MGAAAAAVLARGVAVVAVRGGVVVLVVAAGVCWDYELIRCEMRDRGKYLRRETNGYSKEYEEQGGGK